MRRSYLGRRRRPVPAAIRARIHIGDMREGFTKVVAVDEREFVVRGQEGAEGGCCYKVCQGVSASAVTFLVGHVCYGFGGIGGVKAMFLCTRLKKERNCKWIGEELRNWTGLTGLRTENLGAIAHAMEA